MPKPFVTVTIAENSGAYSATVDEQRYSRALSELAKWKIEGAKVLPAGSVVYLQFVDKANKKAPIDGPLYDGKKNKGKYDAQSSGNTIFIESIVFGCNGSYDYMIGYELDNQLHPLLDPEIVVEGNALLIKRLLQARVSEWQQSLKARVRSVPPKAKPSKKGSNLVKTAKRPATKKGGR